MGSLTATPTTRKEEWKPHSVLQFCYEKLSELGKLDTVQLDIGPEGVTISCLGEIGVGKDICEALTDLLVELHQSGDLRD